jgi:hypothetical protein
MIMKNQTHTPMTPEQAMNNFRLFLELSPHNSYADYRAAVRELARTCIGLGIQDVNKDLLAALEAVLKTCEAGVIHRHETGKPMWSAFDHLKTIARAALKSAKGE